MMKIAFTGKNDGKLFDPNEIVPLSTVTEHKHRVEEWSEQTKTTPQSNNMQPKNHDREGLDAKSQLIIEGVRMMEFRDLQISSGNTKKSKEVKSKDKRQIAAAFMDTFSMPSTKFWNTGNFGKGPLTVIIPEAEKNVEPDKSTHKMSRNVKFSVIKTIDSKEDTHIPGRKTPDQSFEMHAIHENDRDFWKWRLRQRFVQNDELLHTLALQREGLETTFNMTEKLKAASEIKSRQQSLKSPSKLPAFFAPEPHSSRHASVELPYALALPGKAFKYPPITPISTKTRDPIPVFYTPTKRVLTALTSLDEENEIHKVGERIDKSSKPKPQKLQKDPYLAKLLGGKDIFKPETMLDIQTNKNRTPGELKISSRHSRVFGSKSKNAKRNESLESMTDGNKTCSNCLKSDVQVLFEKLTELDLVNSSRPTKAKVNSREPSDGYMNLPLLLETGRFNHYNKLPSLPPFVTDFEKAKSTQGRKSNRNQRGKKSLQINLVDGSKSNKANDKFGSKEVEIENLSTSEWAKKMMLKVKSQATVGPSQNKSSSKAKDGQKRSDAEMDSMIDPDLDDHEMVNAPLRNTDEKHNVMNNQRSKAPADRETNMLFQEIIMSKWKKGKHELRERGTAHKGRGSFAPSTKEDKKSVPPFKSKPRGLDIWLENIRERAKRENLILALRASNVQDHPSNERENAHTPVSPMTHHEKEDV